MFVYTVVAELEQEADAQRYLDWMRSKHLAEVCQAGGATAVLARLDGTAVRFETRYLFASRESFAAYERDHAPRLRAEAQGLFPTGIRFSRSAGDVIATQA